MYFTNEYEKDEDEIIEMLFPNISIEEIEELIMQEFCKT